MGHSSACGGNCSPASGWQAVLVEGSWPIAAEIQNLHLLGAVCVAVLIIAEG